MLLEQLGLGEQQSVRLVSPQATGECGDTMFGLLSELISQQTSGNDARDVTLYRGLCLCSPTLIPQSPRLRVISNGVLGTNRAIWERGQLDVIPEEPSRIPALLRAGAIGNDVLIVRVSSAGRGGSYRVGLVSDYVEAAVESAGKVVAVVTPDMPTLPGAPAIAADRVDIVVSAPGAVPQFSSGAEQVEDGAIAQGVAHLVHDGDTVQIGLGALGRAIARQLAVDRRELGIHTGILDDAMLDLIDSAAVSNARKSIDRGRSVVPIVMGSTDLYRRVHGRADLQLRSVEYTNEPRVLQQLHGFTAINSAVEVDLLGQINAEVAGGRRIGAVGGQREFYAGARFAQDGKAVAVVRSTARSGTVSRIVPRLSDGVATVPAGTVDYVVTEHGIADLRGATLIQRARRLAAIAHPAFRTALLEAADNDSRLHAVPDGPAA